MGRVEQLEEESRRMDVRDSTKLELESVEGPGGQFRATWRQEKSRASGGKP